MKLGPIVEEAIVGGYKASITMTLEDDEIEALGGPMAAKAMIERATEENVRAMNARLEYMRETEGGFWGGSKPEHLAD